MVLLPPISVTPEDLIEWDRLGKELARIKAAEMLLRVKIFGCYFPTPVEGTNDYPLANGYVLKGKYTINREVDEGAFKVLSDELRKQNIIPEKLVQYKPSLVLREYRGLTAEEMHLFDQCLVIKPGAPAMEIVLPKKAQPK